MCQKNKDSSELADGFHNVGFLKTHVRNTCIPGHSFQDTTLGRESKVNQ